MLIDKECGSIPVKGGVKVRRVAVENCDTWFIK